jgi:hypothetical protein
MTMIQQASCHCTAAIVLERRANFPVFLAYLSQAGVKVMKLDHFDWIKSDSLLNRF